MWGFVLCRGGHVLCCATCKMRHIIILSHHHLMCHIIMREVGIMCFTPTCLLRNVQDAQMGEGVGVGVNSERWCEDVMNVESKLSTPGREKGRGG